MLGERRVTRVLSSPAVRCVRTVEPLAEALGLALEARAELAEGSTRDEVLPLIREAGECAVHCTHGDVVERLIGYEGPKGASWVLEVDDEDAVRVLETIPPRV